MAVITFLFGTLLILSAAKDACGMMQVLDRPSFELSEDGKLNFHQLAAKYGHPAREYRVVTDDGYVLSLNRIPGDPRRAILLVHGNTPTADCWIIRGNSSLAITLAAQGYDVWAINLRGTTFSRKHIHMHPERDHRQFFNYTFYEQGVYDLPATVDFVLQATKQKQILGIGHSVGSTLFYIMGAEKPEYNNKIKLAISLAPISFLQTTRGLAALKPFFTPVLNVMRELDMHETLDQRVFGPIIRAVCLEPLGYELCIKGVLFSLLGYDESSLEPEFMFTLFGHFPGGTTVKTFEHLRQIKVRDRFAKFDYGRRLNKRLYNSTQPPEFDLSKVTMKSALFVGREDFLAGMGDAERLRRSLPNVVYYQVMPYKTFIHTDFIWGQHMPTIFYPYLLNLIEKYI